MKIALNFLFTSNKCAIIRGLLRSQEAIFLQILSVLKTFDISVNIQLIL